MRQSLADAAVRGTSTSLTEEKRELLANGDIEGLLALNRQQFGGFSMKGKEDDDADDDGDDDDSDDDDDDDDDDEDEDDEDEDDDKSAKSLKAKDRRIQELSAESAKHRKRASERGRRITELEAEVAKLKKAPKAKSKDDKDEDADDADDSETTRLKEENEKLAERLVTQTLRTEFTDLTTGPKALAQFANPKKAFRLLDLDDVEIDEDGEIIGLDEAVKDLAKSDPYLLLKSSKDDEDDDEDEDEVATRRRRRSTGQPPGSKKRKGNPNRDKLVTKYPALRR